MSPRVIESCGTRQNAGLRVEREGIRFWNVAPDRVRIEVVVENPSDVRSDPGHLTLQAASFGAFVPWRPLGRLAVPAIEPGGAAVVSCERRRPRVRAVADFSNIVPPRVLTARGAPGEGPERSGTPRAWNLWVPRFLSALGVRPSRAGGLPPDLFEVLGRKNFHWAGNVNVLIGRRAVERHMAQALRVHPERPNLAMFLLGGGPFAYEMQLKGTGVDWPHALLDIWSGKSLEQPDGTFELVRGSARGGARPVLFACEPPAGCGEAAVEVHVEQRPTGERAVVEFSLAPDAAGPGCYVV